MFSLSLTITGWFWITRPNGNFRTIFFKGDKSGLRTPSAWFMKNSNYIIMRFSSYKNYDIGFQSKNEIIPYTWNYLTFTIEANQTDTITDTDYINTPNTINSNNPIKTSNAIDSNNIVHSDNVVDSNNIIHTDNTINPIDHIKSTKTITNFKYSLYINGSIDSSYETNSDIILGKPFIFYYYT